MKLHLYQGIEEVPHDVTHIIIHDSVKIISEWAFYECEKLTSVAMGDSVTRIEGHAFSGCIALQHIRLSQQLEYIGEWAFELCISLEVLHLSPSVKKIDHHAFCTCKSLKLFLLPNGIDIENDVGNNIIGECPILSMACGEASYDMINLWDVKEETRIQVYKWLQNRRNELSPLHVLCMETFVSTQLVKGFLLCHTRTANTKKHNYNDYGIISSSVRVHPSKPFFEKDDCGRMALHLLTMNTHATPDTIMCCFMANPNAVICRDMDDMNPLDYASKYNVPGMFMLIEALCLGTHNSEELGIV